MDKYSKLVSNTIIFAIGTFSSKMLSFLLMPFVTRAMSVSDYGAADLVQQPVTILVPAVTLAINSAALRFALDKAVNKKAVFSSGLATTLGGFLVFLMCIPIVRRIEINDFLLSDYMLHIYAFLFVSSMRQLCQQFVRGAGLVRIYAVDGIIATVTMLFFTLFYLYPMQMGVNGYILAIITSDAISVIFLFVTAKLYLCIDLSRWDNGVLKAMWKYSIPLIPTVILWWIINVSDRYMLTYFHELDSSGLYAAASKIPNVVVLFASIFIDAWQLSAVDEYNNKGKGRFFTQIFQVYSGGIFVVAAGLILTCQLLTRLLVADNYYESWQYVPILIISTVFSCMVNFLASVYMAEKKSMMALVTAMTGAVTNAGLNLLLIPRFGANGAAIATAVSFVVVFIFRSINASKYVRIRYNYPKLVFSTLILIAQAYVVLQQVGGSWNYA
ncbi:MAG: polysaccharide biosynthesis C-terminal domain-containing protein, partial [Clostridiales bacterium]|nr:polysaccharide biosynthesis C-terminal domain-containing protein [Clostridiales bacterium]